MLFICSLVSLSAGFPSYAFGEPSDMGNSPQNTRSSLQNRDQTNLVSYIFVGVKSEPGSSGPASPVQGSNSSRASPVRSASTVPSTPPPHSAQMSGSSSSTENSPNIDGERGDLIEFYNKVNKGRHLTDCWKSKQCFTVNAIRKMSNTLINLFLGVY